MGDEDAAGNFIEARFQLKLKTGFFIFSLPFQVVAIRLPLLLLHGSRNFFLTYLMLEVYFEV
jgi:hypothetical protein